MLVEIAIADAYGAGFEFVPLDERGPNDLGAYTPHPRSDGRGGRYTDDTQMSIALAEATLDRGEPWTRESVAERFVAAYRRDPRAGYSSRVRGALEASTSGAELLAAIDANATSCGAAMRSVPLGLCADVEAVRARARAQASVTHDTAEGRESSVVVGLAAFALRSGCAVVELDRWLRSQSVDAAWLAPWEGHRSVPNDARACVRAALTCLRGAPSLSGALRAATSLEGDVDSVAAIAVGLGSLAPGEIAQDLPDALYEGLERGPFGRPFLEAMDTRLREHR